MPFRVLSKLYGSVVILWHAAGQRGIPYLPKERLIELRDRRVREIVAYAAATVPYYRELFHREGIDPRDIRTAEDLERLPLIDKAALREQPRRFVSTSRCGRTAMPFNTTGTTGPPVTVFHDRRSLLANSAYNVRERAAIAEILGKGAGHRSLYIGYARATVDEVRAFLDGARFSPPRRRPLQVSITEPVDKVVEIINDYRPDIIASAGSYVEMLFRTVEARGLEMHRPKMVAYGSDMMSQEGKRLIEEDFNVAVYSSYQAVEAFKIGFCCIERKHFHLHADLTHVRVVDAAGRTLPQGEVGEVVISNLVNRGTVLLNYRLADFAAQVDGPCPCGRTLPLLSALQGREGPIIRLPRGKAVHVRAVVTILRSWSEVIDCQLVQHALDAIELRLMTKDQASFALVRAAVAAAVQRLLGDDEVTVRVVWCERLETDRQGKLQRLVSLMEPMAWP